ncbi:MAG: MTH1187 family thiamine-binding protein [Candidatus Omnitrophota bacterium]
MIAELSIIPVGEGVSISPYVAKTAKIIDESGLDYKINPMGTVVEGEIDEILGLIKKCHKAVMEDAQRVIIMVEMDDRKDKGPSRMEKR